ncbi:MAG: hypothetical protein EA428_04265 [Spirochaetaceae bacterium]|nr:MAG: hypothetical protein EA428_04265 [Spirochaetaceae bacterium]
MEEISEMDDNELHDCSFGVIKMSKDAVVQAVNNAEIELTGLSRSAFIDKNFFTQVAPCTNNYMVAEKYRKFDELDETIPYVFTYMMKPTPVHLRMLKSRAYDSQYLLVDRKDM